MSSQEVIKTVSTKLKHYFDVKRLEDGFDLTGPYSPSMDHPHTKARPTLQYDGLHDKPVKKYFSPREVRVRLTQMKCPEGREDRQGEIRALVKKYMDSTNFVHPTMPEYSYYYTPKGGQKLRVEYQGHGTGSLTRRKKQYRGGYPLLRSVPPHSISKGEAVRLVNYATNLLLATETYDKRMDRSCRGRPSTAKVYTVPSHDIDGRKMRQGSKSKDDSYLYEDVAPSSARKRQIPAWLRKEIQKLDHERGQGVENQHVHPPPERPKSALRRKPLADPLESPETRSREVQTDSGLFNDYEQMERIVRSGPVAEYRVYVRTGNKLGASTKADVFITLYGTKGRSEEILLGESKNHRYKFTKGQEDEFHFTHFHVGEVKKIRIGHNRTELGSGWYLEACTVNDLLDRVSYRFRCKGWLSYRKDGKTKEFFPVDSTRNLPPDSELTETETSVTSDSDEATSDSESTPRVDQSKKSSSSQPTIDFSSNKVQVSSKSDTKDDDDSSTEIPVVRPIEEPTSVDKEKHIMSGPARKGENEEAKSSDACIHEASKDGNLQRVIFLVNHNPELINKNDERGSSPLHIAAAYGHTKLVQWLAINCAELNAVTPSGHTPVHLAALNGHTKSIATMAGMGARIDQLSKNRETPLHLAAMSGRLATCKWLIENEANIDAEDSLNRTPLKLAEVFDHNDLVSYLRSVKRKVPHEKRNFSMTEIRDEKKSFSSDSEKAVLSKTF